MPTHHIRTLDDPRLEAYRDLPKSQPTEETRRFVVEGRFLVERLVSSRFPVESILVDQNRLQLLPNLPADTDIYAIDSSELHQLVGFQFHRGILACGLRRDELRLADVVPATDREALIVICVDLADSANLGGILRCAAAFGADAALVTRKSVDPFSRRVLRVSMGSALQLPIAVSDDLANDLHQLRQQHQLELVASVLDAEADPLTAAAAPPRLGLLIGTEGEGLAHEIVDCCCRRLTIPMQLNTDSLNAAVAAGIFLYHFTNVARR